MISPKVLIVSDDADCASVWVYNLQQKGLVVLQESSLANVIERWSEEIPDLIVIDVQAGHEHQIEICRKLRANSVIPILLFLQVNDESQIIEAYHTGVDECIFKPISPAIFAAKVMVWTRRSWTMPVDGLDHLHTGKFTLVSEHREVVSDDGKVVKLTNLEFRLLHLLMSHPRQVLETSRIVCSIWGCYGEGDNILLKNVVYRLRHKIETDPSQPNVIQTWPGGYSFQDN